MRTSICASAVAALAVTFSSSAFATFTHSHVGCDAPDACETTLDFSKLLSVKSQLEYSDVVGGGDLTVTANHGKLVIVLGELGVSSGGLLSSLDPRIGSGEAIKFSFENDVELKGWDMDDLNLAGSNKFSLSVDGGAAQLFSLDSHASMAALNGKTFTFGYSGDSYFIDSLKFACIDVPVGTVPEPESLGLTLAGLFTVAAISRRRRHRS